MDLNRAQRPQKWCRWGQKEAQKPVLESFSTASVVFDTLPLHTLLFSALRRTYLPVSSACANNYLNSSPVGVAGQGVQHAAGFGGSAGTLYHLLQEHRA